MNDATANQKLDPVAMQREFSEINQRIDDLLDHRKSARAFPWAVVLAAAAVGAAVVVALVML